MASRVCRVPRSWEISSYHCWPYASSSPDLLTMKHLKVCTHSLPYLSVIVIRLEIMIQPL